MAESFSSDAFYDGAREFARTALEAHHAGKHRRVAMDAGTALEHLAKACLANRSPALLIADLKTESAVATLAWLLRVDGAKPVLRIRTIGLWDALARVRLLVPSTVTNDDLRTLVDMRDGVVHAAQDAEVEARTLAAFAQQADTLIADLGRDRAQFWAGQLLVVDALLANASDKLAQAVAVKLAGAEASYEREYGSMDLAIARMIRAAREVPMSATLAADQCHKRCPVCESNGVATGEYDVEFGAPDWDKEGDLTNVEVASVWFVADSFACHVCGLRLDNPAELDAARVDYRWEVEEADWRRYEFHREYDEDAAYEAWREERAEREGWR